MQLQGRFGELDRPAAGETDPDRWFNPGHVGGEDERSKKVRIGDSSAIVEGIVGGTIDWVTDPDFGYAVAAAVPGVDDVELLQPRLLYERQGRLEEYQSMVARLEVERLEYLRGYSALAPAVVEGLEGPWYFKATGPSARLSRSTSTPFT